MRKLILVISVAALVACNRTPIKDNVGSDLSDLLFTLPEGAGTLYTGYSVSFSRYGTSESNDNCSPNKSWAKNTASRNVTVSHQVKNGCDYLIVLELGKVNSANNGLETVYYTNRNVQPGTIVESSKLTGGNVDVTIKVFKTANAPADAPGELQTQKYTSLKIDVTFDTGGDSGSGSEQSPDGGAQTPPGNSTPTPSAAFTEYEKKLKSLNLVSHAGQTAGSVFDKINGAEHFLVKFSWVDCGPCDSFHAALERDQELQRIKQSGSCSAFTVVLPGRGGLEQYQPASAYYKDPQSIARALGTRFNGAFPYVAVINRKTGVISEGSGANYSVINKFKQVCQ